MAAKQFQHALNTSKLRPTVRRLVTRTSDISESFSSSGKFTSSLASARGADTSLDVMEDVPVYRELEEKWAPKWRRLFNRACPQPIRNALKPPTTKNGWVQFMFVHLPILHWLWRYTPKQLIGDTIAGLTIGVTHIPQGNSIRSALCIGSTACRHSPGDIVIIMPLGTQING